MDRPVPPQVSTMSASTSSQAVMMARVRSARSSLTTTWEATLQPCSEMSVSSAAPAESSVMSRVSEAVTMANLMFMSFPFSN